MSKNFKEIKEQYKFYEYTLTDGSKVIAGKTDIDNDFLSLKCAKPNDYWFHIKGMPGSHVILQTINDKTPNKEAIKKAASIAAYHSKAKNGGIVTVSYTFAKYVSKPRGAKPGTVNIKKELTIKVKPEISDDL